VKQKIMLGGGNWILRMLGFSGIVDPSSFSMHLCRTLDPIYIFIDEQSSAIFCDLLFLTSGTVDGGWNTDNGA